MILIMHNEIHSKRERLPHITNQIRIPQLINTASLNEPWHLASIHSSFSTRSDHSNAAGAKNFVASIRLICFIRLAAQLAMQ